MFGSHHTDSLFWICMFPLALGFTVSSYLVRLVQSKRNGRIFLMSSLWNKCEWMIGSSGAGCRVWSGSSLSESDSVCLLRAPSEARDTLEKEGERIKGGFCRMGKWGCELAFFTCKWFLLLFLSQAQCGSCYSFATMGMLEARVRIQTNNTQQPVFSPQQVVSCSQYSQGKSMCWCPEANV